MKKNIAIKALLVFILIIGNNYAEIQMTQRDIVIPSGLKLCDSLPTLSSHVKFPGIYDEAPALNLKTGFFKRPDYDNDYLWQPLTAYDNNANLTSHFLPYISAVKPLKTYYREYISAILKPTPKHIMHYRLPIQSSHSKSPA